MAKTPKKEYCYLNGKIIPVNDAKIPVIDIGVLRGYGIFDSVAGIDDRIVFFDEHYKRFETSAKIMRLKIPLKKGEIKKIIEGLLKRNGYRLSKIRLVLTGGKTIGSLDFDRRSENFFILAEKTELPPKDSYTRGVKLITAEYEREIPRAKSNDYVAAVYLQPSQKKAGATEILYTFRGNVLEATTSNFFIIKGNKLITAKDGILFGITRDKVIGLAKRSMDVEERIVKTSEFKAADEAFITSTYKKVMPVVKIDNLIIGNGKVGPKTRLLMQRYNELEQK
ncbi:aminotransferase class IV [Patescibacteria group bacterium]|nr:aminotransferase class IV [Patescibacteria group bacterium]MCL5114200.1 aminotransferase class IV [Patescibacteria group bacterium]